MPNNEADENVLQNVFGFAPEAVRVIPAPGIMERDGKHYAHCFDGPTREFVEVEVRLHAGSGYWNRRDSFDRDSIKECLDNYTILKCKGKRVMDLGANIGGFTRMAHDQGAALVVAVEPCPYNFDILALNSPKTINLNVAVVPGDESEVDFIYAKSKRNSVSSSTLKRNNSSNVAIKVPARSFASLLEEFRPEVLKCDIEGGEYGLLDAIGAIPSYVEQAAFEFHRGSAPFASYPDRFFPSDVWEKHQGPVGRFASLQDLTFTRRV